MKRNVASGEGINHDEVVRFAVAVQENAAVALEEARVARFPNSEIFLGNVDHAGVKLDRVDCRIRKEATKIGRNRTAAETEHQHALHVLRIDRGNGHRTGIQQRQVVGVG